jgi:hypothetical protein
VVRVRKVKVRELLYLAKERGFGWYIKTFPYTYAEFLEYIMSKYQVDEDAEVLDYKDSEHLIYAILPVSAFKVKPEVSEEEREREELALEMIGGLLKPVSIPPSQSNPIISLFVYKMRLSIPAGSFEEKTVNNRICFAKYISQDKVGVACI